MKTKEITAADRKVIEILLRVNYTPKEIEKRLEFYEYTNCSMASKMNTDLRRYIGLWEENLSTRKRSKYYGDFETSFPDTC